MENNNSFLSLLMGGEPDAIAILRGNATHSDIEGIVRFYALPEEGLLIAAEVTDLPDGEDDDSPLFFAFHIHETGDCSGNFENTGNHYNPENVPHPEHAGDLLPLLSNDGYAWMIFYDSFLTLPMILNRSVVIHSAPDDFTTQPSGNAGEKIACGVITESASYRQMEHLQNHKEQDPLIFCMRNAVLRTNAKNKWVLFPVVSDIIICLQERRRRDSCNGTFLFDSFLNLLIDSLQFFFRKHGIFHCIYILQNL